MMGHAVDCPCSICYFTSDTRIHLEMLKYPFDRNTLNALENIDVECYGADRSVQCPGCSEFMDPEVCWCGDTKEGHQNPWDCGHAFVPMGCDCMKGVKPVNWEKYTGLTEAQLKEIKDGD